MNFNLNYAVRQFPTILGYAGTTLNIAVVTKAIPPTGISLPFFSYGGTALMMQLAEMGVLLNISRHAKLN